MEVGKLSVFVELYLDCAKGLHPQFSTPCCLSGCHFRNEGHFVSKFLFIIRKSQRSFHFKNLIVYDFSATFVYAGGWVGNVIALQSSGVLAASSMGWPSIFYIWGSITLIWSIVWYFLGKDSPSEHLSIPLDEKEYIEVSLGVTETTEVNFPSQEYNNIIFYKL